MTDYTWTVAQLVSTSTGVVIAVEWVVEAVQAGKNKSVIGVYRLGDPNPAEFVAYEDLTPELVLSWLPESYKEEAEARANALLAEANSTSLVVGTPW